MAILTRYETRWVRRACALLAVSVLLALSALPGVARHLPGGPDAVAMAAQAQGQGEVAPDAHAGPVADQEQPVHALPLPPGKPPLPRAGGAAGGADGQMTGLIRDGPRRPPRLL